ncbi:hypothetical protein RB195_006532 [Necator americanus]|uniref:Uncharacterized protein n=1 Tax=Necator americanus TaxID=51031 RepID=A0ABR1BWI4_NECAM
MSWEAFTTRSWDVIKYVDLRPKQPRTILDPGLMVNLNKESRLLTVFQDSIIIEQVPLFQQPVSARYRDADVVLTLSSPSLFIKFRIRLSNTADRCSLCLALSEFMLVDECIPQSKGPRTRLFVDNVSSTQNSNTREHSSQNYQSNFCELSCNSSSSQQSLFGSEYRFSSQPEFHNMLSQRKLSQEIFSTSPQPSHFGSSPFHSSFSPLSSQPSFSPHLNQVKFCANDRRSETLSQSLDQSCQRLDTTRYQTHCKKIANPTQQSTRKEAESQADCTEVWGSTPEEIRSELSRLINTTATNDAAGDGKT